jgi:hypothetical protein
MPKPVEIVSALTSFPSTQKLAVLVEVLVNGEVALEITDEVTDGSVNANSGSAARRTVDLTVAGVPELLPTSPTSLLAPYGNELRVSRGIEFDDRIELVRLGVFRLDRTTIDSSQGETVRLSAIDRAAKFMAPDGAFETPGEITSGTLAGQAIIDLLTASDPGLDYESSEFIGAAAPQVPLPTVVYQEADDRWGFVQGIAVSIGFELYFDTSGKLRLQPIPQAGQGSPAFTIAEGEGGTLLSASRDIDRGPVYNAWIVTGENLTEEDVVVRAFVKDENVLSPTYYEGAFGKKIGTYNNAFISTNTQATDAANGLLARSIGRPDVVSFSAVVDPARSPSDVIRIERDVLGLAEEHILDSVSIPLNAEGEMSGQTRAAQVFG